MLVYTMMSIVLTARVLPDLKEKLDDLAKSTHRARSWLINEALRSYLDSNAWQVQAIKEGVQAAEGGNLISGDEMDEWLKTWGTAEEKAAPR
ncbi:MAG: CopG family ribbon-helix-helix protein [Myxococcaceae bacterium]